MHFPAILAALAALAGAPAFAQVNRCDTPAGVVYQGAPCPRAGETVGADMARRERDAAQARQAAAERLQREAAERQRDTAALVDQAARERAAREKVCGVGGEYREVAIGMPEAILLHCTAYTSPADVNVTRTAAGESKQFVFRPYGRGGPSRYVYTRNGLVYAVQN